MASSGGRACAEEARFLMRRCAVRKSACVRGGLVIAGLCYGCLAPAFIYDVTTLRKWDGSRGRYQKVLAYSDFHDQLTAVTQQAHATQFVHIDTFLKKVNKKSCKIIVEDLCAANDRGCACCGHFCVRPRGGILGGLTEKCQAAGALVCNVEYRFCRVTSLGPVFNAPSADPASFVSTKTITVSALCDEIARTIGEIETYRDGSFLQNVYQKGVAAVKKKMYDFALARENAVSVARYVGEHMRGSKKLEMLKDLLTFDSQLLDYKILHQIATSADKALIVLFAGGSHCANVCEALEKMGYARVGSEPQKHDYLGAGVPKPLNLALVAF